MKNGFIRRKDGAEGLLIGICTNCNEFATVFLQEGSCEFLCSKCESKLQKVIEK